MNEKEFIEGAVKLLDKRTAEYTQYKDIIANKINAKLTYRFKGVSVSGRVKDKEKIPEKIYRKNYMQRYKNHEEFIDDLPDGIGIRIVCLLVEEETKIYNLLQAEFAQTKEYNGENYCHDGDESFLIKLDGQPEMQKNGLSIYRMDAMYFSNGNTVRVEMQIKSLTHFFWGELEHSLFYKNYNYILGNSFYARLMKNIHYELDTIDSEMSELQKHMDNNIQNQVNELRQIAALMISKRYTDEIEKIIGCKIDLREAFVLITDLHFGLVVEQELNLKKLNELMEKLQNAKSISETSLNVKKQNLEEGEYGSNYSELAHLIDKNIKTGDVYWLYFYLMYEGIFNSSSATYSHVIGDMCTEIYRLFDDIVESGDALIMTGLDVQKIVRNVVIRVAKNVNKISFFLLDQGMVTVKEIMKKTLDTIQNIIMNSEHAFESELIIKNAPTVEAVLYITLMQGIKENICEWEWLLNAIKAQNDFHLYLDSKIYGEIIENGDLNEDQLSILVELEKEDL